jgi:hypothetical protein
MLAGTTGWFPHYLPLAGNAAAEASIVIGTAVVLHEIVELTRESVREVRAWRRNVSHKARNSSQGRVSQGRAHKPATAKEAANVETSAI